MYKKLTLFSTFGMRSHCSNQDDPTTILTFGRDFFFTSGVASRIDFSFSSMFSRFVKHYGCPKTWNIQGVQVFQVFEKLWLARLPWLGYITSKTKEFVKCTSIWKARIGMFEVSLLMIRGGFNPNWPKTPCRLYAHENNKIQIRKTCAKILSVYLIILLKDLFQSFQIKITWIIYMRE